ncbi:MAG TPA: histidine phosphatase family protein [Geminicoccus sp.]|uniref:histidine phosphatase family protein n=1 Tax=Geminicoccus sp. TaxID=2024832 RepID=UPI002C7F1C02|nr:histidine phosphatase family protein [Geminicoccus sp.]HWL68051.1 histidine phosphatase family protein [Geminicoccus sp.]
MTANKGWCLLRHAPTEGPFGRFVGRSDRAILPPAADDATALIEQIGAIDVAVVTPARRSRETLAWLEAAGLQVPLRRTERDLLEQDFGRWEEQAYDRLAQGDPAYWPFWDDPVRRVPPGGESFQQVFDRAVAAFERLDRALAGARVLHVGHAGPIRALLTWAEHGTADAALRLTVAHLSPVSLRHPDPGESDRPALAVSSSGMIGSPPQPGRGTELAAAPPPATAAGSGTT